MICGKVVILNEKGLHLRLARILSDLALTFPCSVYIKVREYHVSAKSLLGVLSAQVKCGEEIVIECEGVQEKEALLAITSMAENKFEEENSSLA